MRQAGRVNPIGLGIPIRINRPDPGHVQARTEPLPEPEFKDNSLDEGISSFRGHLGARIMTYGLGVMSPEANNRYLVEYHQPRGA